MHTRLMKMNLPLEDSDEEKLNEAAQLIRAGEVVAVPTETVYGLAANAFDELAVKKIFSAKQRPADNPLIVHIADQSQLTQFCEPLNAVEETLIDHFWPGPLTLVLGVRAGVVPAVVTAGLNTVAVRLPDHPVMLALLHRCGVPLAAPSANRSGRPSPTKADHVRRDLDGEIPLILDGGSTTVGIESTVVRLVDQRLHILRPGMVSKEDLQAVLPSVVVECDATEDEAPRSPGVKYAHYAPSGEMVVVESAGAASMRDWIQVSLDEAKAAGHRTGLLTFSQEDAPSADVIIRLGHPEQPVQIAKKLYDSLREFDDQQVTFIIAEACSRTGAGAAIMNRLLKAASNNLIRIE